MHALKVPHSEGPLGEARKNSQGRSIPGSQCNKGRGGNKLAGAPISLSGPQAREQVILAQRVCVRSKEGHMERPARSPPAQGIWTRPKPFSLANTFKPLDRSHRTHPSACSPGHDSTHCPAPGELFWVIRPLIWRARPKTVARRAHCQGARGYSAAPRTRGLKP